jgi:hypothetical protein
MMDHQFTTYKVMVMGGNTSPRHMQHEEELATQRNNINNKGGMVKVNITSSTSDVMDQ